MIKRSLAPHFLFFAIALAGILVFSAAAAFFPPKIALALTLGIAVVIISLVSPEAALYLLIFSMLLSPELGVGGGGREDFLEKDRPTTLRLDDLLLVIIGFTWFARTAIFKELGLFLRSPLNRPIAFYLLACFLSTGVGILLGRVPLKSGFFFTLKYLEYFIVYFMVINHLGTRKQVKRWTIALLTPCHRQQHFYHRAHHGALLVPGGDGGAAAGGRGSCFLERAGRCFRIVRGMQ